MFVVNLFAVPLGKTFLSFVSRMSPECLEPAISATFGMMHRDTRIQEMHTEKAVNRFRTHLPTSFEAITCTFLNIVHC